MKIKRMLTLSLLAAVFAAAAPSAHADGDVVRIGGNIHVAQDSEAHDVVCIFCDVNIEGKVTGDVVVLFGDVHLAGDAQHDVVSIFGNVVATNNASIEQDLVSVFGAVRLGENVTVGQDLVALFGALDEASSVTVGNDTVVKPGWIVWGPLLVVILVLFVLMREYRAYRRRLVLRGYNFPPKT
ncbi:MAG: hypothetical protein P4K94_00225 [Terracidiphilus sp.]|nr:hypothetical protein [Terracidiphilus sp.]